MITLFTGVTLFMTSFLVWIFGLRRYVSRNKGPNYIGANIAISAWNDFSVAKELRKKNGNQCYSIEGFLILQLAGYALIFLGVIRLI